MFTIVIVGRPNVGKSTLFNRLTFGKKAIVHNKPGVTRDRREAQGKLFDLSFQVIDTAGFEDAPTETLQGRMREQTEKALENADIILMLVDVRAGITPLDMLFSSLLYKSQAPVILCANKCEGRDASSGILESYRLGFGEAVAISAEHNLGMEDLYQALRPHVDSFLYQEKQQNMLRSLEENTESLNINDETIEEETLSEKEQPIQIVIVGRPNVGKSTLINHLIGEERLLTGAEAGITRDSISVQCSFFWQGVDRSICLIDTAGLRRQAKVSDKVESLSTQQSLASIRYAHVVALVLDPHDGLEKQDLVIARRVLDEGRALFLVLNKWDLVKNPQEVLQKLYGRLDISLAQARGIPVVACSALKGENIKAVFQTAFDLYALWNHRIPTARLNQFLEEAVMLHPPPLSSGGRRPKIRYMTQIKTRPPTFMLQVSRGDAFSESWLRYLLNSLREAFDLPAVPLRVKLRQGRNPYVNEKK